jgi:hypothetical protein
MLSSASRNKSTWVLKLPPKPCPTSLPASSDNVRNNILADKCPCSVFGSPQQTQDGAELCVCVINVWGYCMAAFDMAKHQWNINAEYDVVQGAAAAAPCCTGLPLLLSPPPFRPSHNLDRAQATKGITYLKQNLIHGQAVGLLVLLMLALVLSRCLSLGQQGAESLPCLA